MIRDPIAVKDRRRESLMSLLAVKTNKPTQTVILSIAVRQNSKEVALSATKTR